MDNFTINGRVYQARELDFNFVCFLGENGIELKDIGSKIIPSIRCYIAYCMGVDVYVAGEEFQKHIVANNGDFDEVMNIFSKKAEESDFFQALAKKNGSKTTPKKTTKKSQEE